MATFTKEDHPFNKMTRLTFLLLITGILYFGCESTHDQIPFRAILQGYSHPENPTFFDKDYWQSKMVRWNRERYNAIIWYGPGELTNGEHLLVRHLDFPEAREISMEENERIIDQMNWMFTTAKDYGLKSFLQTQPIFYTEAFGKAHGFDTLNTISTQVGKWHIEGYPNFWPSTDKPNKIFNCHIRNDLTTAYTTAVFGELLQLYPDLHGFMGFNGEPLPGNRSTFFGEAIAPALKASNRNPIYIANQWQTPIDQFIENIAGAELYKNLWLGFHGYNSEQITDAKPYPGTVYWAEKTGLPTIVEIYPANQNFLPWNSPKFAYDIVQEIKKIPAFEGYVYYERHISGTLLGPLFREALGYYSGTGNEYDENYWIEKINEQFDNREASGYFLEAYNISSRIIPEADAFIYSGGDVMKRELRVPYSWFTADWPWNYMTSPARGGRLIPFRHYVNFVAKDPGKFKNKDGSEADEYPYYQQVIWASEGGSIFNITPEKHFARIKGMGIQAYEASRKGLELVKSNKDEAQRITHLMNAYRLLATYYESKVRASVMGAVYAMTKEKSDQLEALEWADKALADYTAFVDFSIDNLDPYYQEISGAPLNEAGVRLNDLLVLEKMERDSLAIIFEW